MRTAIIIIAALLYGTAAGAAGLIVSPSGQAKPFTNLSAAAVELKKLPANDVYTKNRLHIFNGGNVVPNVTQDLPLAASTVEVNSYDNPPTNNGNNFNVVSQMWSGVTPTASPIQNFNIALAGSFAVHRGGKSGTNITSLNPMTTSDARPTGVIDVSGTAVTWVSGDKFLTGTGWENATIYIGPSSTTPVGVSYYTIASVQDDTHLTLKSTAGSHTGYTYLVGGNITVEIDLNSRDDVFGGWGHTGLAISSGSTHKAGTALTIGAAFPSTPTSDNASWYYGALITEFRNTGLLISPVQTDTTTAKAIDATNGSTGSSFIRGGAPALRLEPTAGGAALLLTPGSDVATDPIMYGTDAANGYVRWIIAQNGGTHMLHQAHKQVTYSGTMAINVADGGLFTIIANNGTGFTISNPTATGTAPQAGQEITVRIYNTSGGALGTATWDTKFKMTAWTNPATGYNRSITFQYDGNNWYEKSRNAADIPN